MYSWEQLHREYSEKNRKREEDQRKNNGLKAPKSDSVSNYYYKLSKTKRWWGEPDSDDYVNLISTLTILNHLENTEGAFDNDKQELYNDLKDKCAEYLRNHSGYKWTFVERRRYRLIDKLSKLLNNITGLGPLQTFDIVPYFTDTDEEKRQIQTINREFASKPIYGQGGSYNYFLNGEKSNPLFRNMNAESDVIKSIRQKLIGKENTKIHIGNKFHINGLVFERVFHLCCENHMEENEMEAMFNDLLADDEDKNINGMRQYKKVLYSRYEHIYKKYGKYVYQLHPVDIVSRSSGFQKDILFLQDMSQYFGMKGNDFKTCESNFNDKLEKNPILNSVFTEDERETDLFFLKLTVYYNYIFLRLSNLNSPGCSQMFDKGTVYKNISLEKDIESSASKWGPMKGLDEEQKAVYLLNLRRRNLDKEFNLNERLLGKDERETIKVKENESIADYYHSLAATRNFKVGYEFKYYDNLLSDLTELNKLEKQENSDTNAKFELYKSIKEKCRVYLKKNAMHYRQTNISKERYNLVSGLLNKMELMAMDVSDIVPYFITDNNRELKNKTIERNNNLRNSEMPMFGNGWGQEERTVYGVLSEKPDGSELNTKNESATVGEIKKLLKEKGFDKEPKPHIGNRILINSGLGISRMLALHNSKGFHMDEDEEKNLKNMQTMFENLLAGEDYDNSENEKMDPEIKNVTCRACLTDDELKNLKGVLQYKKILYSHYKYLYQKYGKYLYQLHPTDILLKTDNFNLDIVFAQDAIQLLGLKSLTNVDFDECKGQFEENLAERPILKLVFPENKSKQDALFLKLVVYYNYALSNIRTIQACAVSGDFSQATKDFFKKEEIDKLVALEDDIESTAKKYKLGPMKGFSKSEKEEYLLDLKRRGMDEEFFLDERLSAK